MFGISFSELLILMVVVLIVFGPEKLPEMARSIGKVLGILKRQADLVRREFYSAVYTPTDELNKELADVGRELKTVTSKLRKVELTPLCPDYNKISQPAEAPGVTSKPDEVTPSDDKQE